MTVPLWVAELTTAFWDQAGRAEPFPRGLRGPITRALPVAVVYLPHLSLADVRAWLFRNRVACPCDEADRLLRACLVARSGHGFIFIDGSDPENEQRFSLAHELAHFLRDYWHPRRLACERLGQRVSEVFDGKRPPTAEERLNVLLARVPIGFHVHLMQRDAQGQFANEAIAVAERDADRLAYELLAPAGTVLAQLRGNADGAGRPALVRLLQVGYGLPAVQAVGYSDILLPSPTPDPLLKRLGLAS